MAGHVLRYDKMPIPAIDGHTCYLEAGGLRIGIEYRVLDDIVTARARLHLEQASGSDTGQLTELDDRGVSLHVYTACDEGWRENLRFDCFEEDPHYHYVSWSERRNEVLYVDPVADGDPLAWALDRIRQRLPAMLRRAEPGAEIGIDWVAVDALMPRVAATAYEMRFNAPDEAVRVVAHGAHHGD